jgi:VanZ family protein
MLRRRQFWLLVLAWAALIFALSSVPGTSLPHLAMLKHDKILHAVLYAPMGAFCLLAIRARTSARGAVLVVLAAAVAGLYGLTDELHQKYVPHRTADLFDALADLVGGTVGALVALYLPLARFDSRGPRKRPVYESGELATSSGVPEAMSRPPESPPP